MKWWYFFITICAFIHITQCLESSNGVALRDSSQHLSRKKRWLVWKDGVNWVACLESSNGVALRDSSQHLSRKKRWLVWKDGVNWVAVIFGIGIPVEVQYQSITLGMVMKAYYQLPNNSSYYLHPSIDFERKKRSATRWKIYDMIESYMERNKFGDGKACLLKSICEVSAVPLEERSGLLAEIVHSILTPSSTEDEIEDHSNNVYHAAEKLGKEFENCDELFPECPDDPVKQFSRLMTVNKFMY